MQGYGRDAVYVATTFQLLVTTDAATEVNAAVFLQVYDPKNRLEDQISQNLTVQLCNGGFSVKASGFELHAIPFVVNMETKFMNGLGLCVCTLGQLFDVEVSADFIHKLL